MTIDIKILDRIDQDLKQAMKSGDKIRLETVRSIRAALKEKEIALRADKKELDDEVILSTISTAAKKRKEAISEYRNAGREDRAAEEAKELDIILEYLPKQLSSGEIEERVKKAVVESGASSMKDMGKVMSLLMAELKGKADGREVQNTVKRVLADVK